MAQPVVGAGVLSATGVILFFFLFYSFLFHSIRKGLRPEPSKDNLFSFLLLRIVFKGLNYSQVIFFNTIQRFIKNHLSVVQILIY